MRKNYKLVLIGDPVYHSKSPLIYSELFKKYDVDGSFSVVRVEKISPDMLLIPQIKSADAIAVTMPHKRAVFDILTEIAPSALASDSVNFIIKQGDCLTGHCTDGMGFVSALKSRLSDINGVKFLINGCGGAAASVAYSLNQCGGDVFLFGRNKSKAIALADRLSVKFADSLSTSGFDVFINATPLGMHGFEDYSDFSFLTPSLSLVCDLIYEPSMTALLSHANDMNIPTMNGLPMLLHQAEEAFSLLRRSK